MNDYMQDKGYYLYEVLSLSTFILLILLITVLIICISYFIGGISYARYKHTPFESGVTSYGSAQLRFKVHFYLIGIFFLIFDVESLYLYLWSVSVKEISWCGFVEAILFVCVLFIGLIYIIQMKSFCWSDNVYHESLIKNLRDK